jgi:hypothetical protein
MALTHVESVYKQLRPKNSAHYFRAYLTLRQAVEPLFHRIQLTPVDLYADSDPSLVALRTGAAVRRDGVASVKHNHFDKQTKKQLSNTSVKSPGSRSFSAGRRNCSGRKMSAPTKFTSVSKSAHPGPRSTRPSAPCASSTASRSAENGPSGSSLSRRSRKSYPWSSVRKKYAASLTISPTSNTGRSS